MSLSCKFFRSCLEATTIKKSKNFVNDPASEKKAILIFYMPDRLPPRFYRWLRAVGGCAKSLLNPRCRCPRCVDPTEFGTNTSGLPCGSCQGLLLPQVTPTESEYRVSSRGVRLAWMSPPVKYNMRIFLAIFVIYPVGSHGRFNFPARYRYYLPLGLRVIRREGIVSVLISETETFSTKIWTSKSA